MKLTVHNLSVFDNEFFKSKKFVGKWYGQAFVSVFGNILDDISIAEEPDDAFAQKYVWSQLNNSK